MLKIIGGVLMQPEFLGYIGVNLITIGVVYGALKTQVRYIEQSINRLEIKQDKHNGLISRMFVVEEKIENVVVKVDSHAEDAKNNKN